MKLLYPLPLPTKPFCESNHNLSPTGVAPLPFCFTYLWRRCQGLPESSLRCLGKNVGHMLLKLSSMGWGGAVKVAVIVEPWRGTVPADTRAMLKIPPDQLMFMIFHLYDTGGNGGSASLLPAVTQGATSIGYTHGKTRTRLIRKQQEYQAFCSFACSSDNFSP